MKERVVSGFNASRAVILMSRTDMSVEKIVMEPRHRKHRGFYFRCRCLRFDVEVTSNIETSCFRWFESRCF